jgi:Zn-dependent M28 family amino/carboxypeptidase
MTQSHPSRRSRIAVAGTAGVLALAGSVVTALPAAAGGPGGHGGGGGNSCEHRNNNTVDKLLECVTVDGVMEHLNALQGIADANGGTRASGTPGYTASADYVQARLEAAGYEVTRQPFDFTLYELKGTPTFSVDGEALEYGTGFADMSYSGKGTVSGTGVAVDPGSGNSGCEATDFTPAVAGQIAVVERGSCPFGTKAANAEAAGAAGVVIINNTGGDELIGGTLGEPVGIPALDVSQNTGPTLVGQPLSISIDTSNTTQTTENVLAELPGRTDEVVQVGAHLDSVPEGPGINDDGSGSAAILELAENVRKAQFPATVRFSWWGAEESGLLGSTHYVSELPDEEIARISAYLNFDMIGSPNFVRFVYDSDGEDFDSTPAEYVSDRSTQIEDTFEKFYADRGLANENTEFDGRSDYQAFADAGVPSGGLFTGAEGVKTEEQAAVYGGTAGEWYDPCYHQACDDIHNLDLGALDENADAVAYATLTLAGAPGSH